ncbi:MAG: arginase family protein, partial [Rhodobacteraceae bacterium]|nr:arginase family protein [Paracoccaceae bacterium]
MPANMPFMGARTELSFEEADAVIFGAPHGTPYKGIPNDAFGAAPDALRGALKDDFELVEHWDFDLDGPLFADTDFKLVDGGNLDTAPQDGGGNRAKIAEATARIVESGAIPLMIGG